MSKKNKKNIAAESVANTENQIVNNETTTVVAEPTTTATVIDQESGEEIVVTADAGKIDAAVAEFMLPKGRPVNPDSARQKRLAEIEAKRIAAGGVLHRGRPVNPESDRQKHLATKGESKTGKQGRPVNENSERQKKLAVRNAKIEALKAAALTKATVPAELVVETTTTETAE